MSLSDGAGSVYKKLVLSADKKRLLGGILVGDAACYGELLALTQTGMAVPEFPEALLLPAQASGGAGRLGVDALPDAAMICSCHNIDKGTICQAISSQKLTAVGAIAGWLPAYRASQIDPARVLRDS